MHQTGELSKKTEQKKKCSFSFCYLFLCENCRWFLHPPIASLSSPLCRICLTGGKHSSKFIWPLYFFFSFLFLLICNVSVDWVMSCLPNRAFVLVCASAETGKTCLCAPFFFFDLPLPLAAAACTHADKVVPTFHVESCLTKTEVAFCIIPELF